MPRVVVLGTGTSVGKTFVTTALLRALGRRGLSTLGLKPVETGVLTSGSSPPPGSDAYALEQASSAAPPRPHPPFAFDDPISPHLAARRANRALDPATIVRWMRDTTIQYPHGAWHVVETAGGALSPLSDNATNADLAAALAPAVLLLVAPDALGVLHDVTATLAGLRARAREPDYVVLTAARPPDASTGTNAAELRRLEIADPIAVLRPSDESAIEQLAAALVES